MSERERLVELERAGWRALCSTPDDAEAFYATILDDDVVVLLPGAVRIVDREAALRVMGAAPWDGCVLEDVRVTFLRTGVGLVTSRVVARRGRTRYAALVSTLYVRRAEGWRLVLHQQTPE